MAQEPNIFMSILPLVVLFGIFYFLIIRPQQKETQKHKDMLEGLKHGDKIITAGGLHAKVVKVDTDFLRIRLNDTTEVTLSKDYVAKKVDDTTETQS